MEDRKMKAQMIEKSGFPKPQGLLLILLIIGLLGLVQCIFSQPIKTNNTDNRLDYPGVEEEIEMQVEACILNDTSLLQNYNSGFIPEEVEPEISIEPWMLNFEEFEQKVTEIDPETEIEEWMTDDSYWLISTDSYSTQNEEQDKEIELEEWMYDLKYWKKVYYEHEILVDK